MSEPEIVAPLTDLYKAGKETFPHFAGMVAQGAEELSGFYDVWQEQLAATGNAPALAGAVALKRLVEEPLHTPAVPAPRDGAAP